MCTLPAWLRTRTRNPEPLGVALRTGSHSMRTWSPCSSSQIITFTPSICRANSTWIRDSHWYQDPGAPMKWCWSVMTQFKFFILKENFEPAESSCSTRIYALSLLRAGMRANFYACNSWRRGSSPRVCAVSRWELTCWHRHWQWTQTATRCNNYLRICLWISRHGAYTVSKYVSCPVGPPTNSHTCSTVKLFLSPSMWVTWVIAIPIRCESPSRVVLLLMHSLNWQFVLIPIVNKALLVVPAWINIYIRSSYIFHVKLMQSVLEDCNRFCTASTVYY
jgi:hypothetical protein